MPRYYSYIDDECGCGDEVLEGMRSNGCHNGIFPSQDIEARDITALNKLILRSPSGKLFQLSVDDSGNLTTTAV